MESIIDLKDHGFLFDTKMDSFEEVWIDGWMDGWLVLKGYGFVRERFSCLELGINFLLPSCTRQSSKGAPL